MKTLREVLYSIMTLGTLVLCVLIAALPMILVEILYGLFNIPTFFAILTVIANIVYDTCIVILLNREKIQCK